MNIERLQKRVEELVEENKQLKDSINTLLSIANTHTAQIIALKYVAKVMSLSLEDDPKTNGLVVLMEIERDQEETYSEVPDSIHEETQRFLLSTLGTKLGSHLLNRKK